MTRPARRPLALALALLAALAGALLGAVAPAAYAEPSAQPDRGWITSSTVHALARHGDRLFLGGAFNAVGRRANGGAVVDRTDGAPDLAWPDAGQGSVRAVVPDGAGGWYVGGSFVTWGGAARARLVHLKADRSVDLAFDAAIGNGNVHALALAPDGTLYVGGDFTVVGGVRLAHARLVALDAATGAVAWRQGATAPVVDGSVSTLALSDHGTLYAGGSFSAAGAAPRSMLAELRRSDATPTSWAPEVTGIAISAIEPAGDRVYVGGTFAQIGGAARTNVAALDEADGSAVAGWNAHVSGGRVLAVAPAGDGVVLAGDFTAIGPPGAGVSRSGLAEVSAADGAPRAWKPALSGAALTVSAAEVHEGTVYVLGRFDAVGRAPRNGAAAFALGDPDPTAWDPSLGLDDLSPPVDMALALADDAVFVGGVDLRAVDVRPRAGIAAVDLAADALLPLRPSVESGSTVRALAVSEDGRTLYAGGDFTEITGVPRAGLAAFDADGDGSRPLAWDPGAVGSPAPGGGRARPSVAALLVRGGDVIAGGEFERLGAVTSGAPPLRRSLGAVDGTTGQATGFVAHATRPPADGYPDGEPATVRALALAPDGATLYAGGSFQRIGATRRPLLAAVDPQTGAPRAWDPGPRDADGDVQALVTHGDRVHVGGRFTRMGAQAAQPARRNLAEIDAGSGDATPFDPSPDGEIRALAVDPDGVLYVGSETMAELAGQTRRGLGAIRPDGTLSPWDPAGTQFSVAPYVLLASGRDVIAGATAGTIARGEVIGSLPHFRAADVAPPTMQTRPTIGGTPSVGGALTCAPGDWGGTRPHAYAYAWLRDGAPVAGASAVRYVVTPDDAEAALACRVTATNLVGEATAESAPVRVAGEVPRNFEPPAVEGDPHPGETLTCTSGIWANYPKVDGYAYAWLRDGAPVAGADGAELRVRDADLDHAFACEVTAFNAVGRAPAVRSAAVRVVVRPPAPPVPPGPPAPPAPGPDRPASPPPSPGGTGPAPPAGPAPALRIAGGAAVRADARGRVALRVSCPQGTAACAGRVTLTARLRSRGRTRTVTVGTANVRVGAGRTATVRVTLTAAARAALRRAKRLRVVATARLGSATTTRSITVRAAAGGRR